jgi:SpoIIAA-like
MMSRLLSWDESMITIQKNGNLITVAALGEFTLTDYKEFEEEVLYKSHFDGRANLLFDWRDMVSYTLDVAWEEIKAVVVNNKWQAWSVWVSNLFIGADVRVFGDYDEAELWAAA